MAQLTYLTPESCRFSVLFLFFPEYNPPIVGSVCGHVGRPGTILAGGRNICPFVIVPESIDTSLVCLIFNSK